MILFKTHFKEEQILAMREIRAKTGIPVAFQIRSGIDMYLESMKDQTPGEVSPQPGARDEGRKQ